MMAFPIVVVTRVLIYVRAQQAEAGPPLGTVLGNLGINATKFCKEFNEYTKELPAYFLLPVEIYLSEDKSFSFKVSLPPIGALLSLLRYEREVSIAGKKIREQCISLKDVVELAQLKMPAFSLERSVRTVVGSALAAGLKVVREEKPEQLEPQG